MELDLLFLAVKKAEWRNVTENGTINPSVFSKDGQVRSFVGTHAEKIINHNFEGNETVLLVVLDPLRIQSPIKHIKEDGFEYVAIQGEVSMDTIIDKIDLKPDKKGVYSVNVKHFD